MSKYIHTTGSTTDIGKAAVPQLNVDEEFEKETGVSPGLIKQLQEAGQSENPLVKQYNQFASARKTQHQVDTTKFGFDIAENEPVARQPGSVEPSQEPQTLGGRRNIGIQDEALTATSPPALDTVGSEGTPLAPSRIQKLAEEERNRQQNIIRQNETAKKIQLSSDLDSKYKSDYNLGSRTAILSSIQGLGKVINDIEVDIQEPNKPPVKKSGLVALTDHFNKDVSVEEQVDSLAVNDLLFESIVSNSKILLSKSTPEALQEGDTELDKFLSDFNLEAFDETSFENKAFHDQTGKVGVKEGALGRIIVNNVVESLNQARRSDNKISKSDTALAKVVERALIDSGYVVPGVYKVLNAKGEPTQKNKELGQDHKAQFITRKLYDVIRQVGKNTGLDPIKLSAQSVTDPTGRAVGEFRDKAKTAKTARPKGIEAQRKGAAERKTVYGEYTEAYRKSYRSHDLDVNTRQAFYLSALSTYANTPSAQRQQLSNDVQAFAAHAAKIYKFDLAEVNKLDPSDTTREGQLRSQNFKQKLGIITKQVADARALQQAMPEGHRIGEASFVDETSQRNYPLAYNSSEQNSRVHRGSLKGHNRVYSTSLLANNTRSDAQLISAGDLESIRTVGKNRDARHEEIAALLMLGREFINPKNIPELHGINTTFVPDDILIRYITPSFIKGLAGAGASLTAINQAVGQLPEFDSIIQQDPSQLPVGEIQLPPESKKGLMVSNALSEMEPKHAGQTEQMLVFAANYVNASETGLKSVKGGFQVLPDMNSAGRFQSAIYSGGQKGYQLISTLGFVVTNSNTNPEFAQKVGADGVDWSVKNPRAWTAENIVDSLERKMLDGVDNLDDPAYLENVTGFLESMFNDTNGVNYADELAKFPNMVVDYGMGIYGASQQGVKGLENSIKKWNDDWLAKNEQAIINGQETLENSPSAQYDRILKSSGISTEAANQYIADVTAEALIEVTNPQFSKAQQMLGTAAGMLDLPLVSVGYDGQVLPIGKRGRRRLPGASVTVTGSSGQELFGLEGPIRDTPEAAAEAKFIKETAEWNEPLPYSAQSQAYSPGIGHVTERAFISEALKLKEQRMGPHQDIILDGHDSIGMSPLDSFVYQQELQGRAVEKVSNAKIPSKSVARNLQVVFDEIKGIASSDTEVVLGPDSEKYFHITDYLDGVYSQIVEAEVDARTAKDPKALANLKRKLQRQIRMLHDAQNKGVWSPKGSSRTLLGLNFNPSEKATADSFSVEPKLFAKWYIEHVFNPARKEIEKHILSLGDSQENLIKDLMNVQDSKRSFFTNNRKWTT